jgi:DNA invertase Pin-like site-specific DNA recombinase
MDQNKKLINENYQHLKSLLSYGDITNIANNTGFCRGTVYNVLNGCSTNGKILSEIVRILELKIRTLQKIQNLVTKKKAENT